MTIARWSMLVEWIAILLVGFLYAGQLVLDQDPRRIQQTGEHEESATLPILTEIAVRRYGELPRWNPYMLTGFPLAGDFVNHLWHPVSTVPVLVLGGINGMKTSVFLAFLLAGFGQWLCAHAFGVRGPTRLWTALMFMTCGGLALLWRLGWYELLLGAAWFPWCFAAVWLALHRRGLTSVALASLAIAMVLTTGGGYYPVYLFGSLAVVVGMSLAYSSWSEWRRQLVRAAAIALLAAGLVAVVVLPWRDSYRFTGRDALPDKEQRGSQPIAYALVNYVVSEHDWLHSTALGRQGGFTWSYIGWIPLAALGLVPLALKDRKVRPAIVTAAALTLFLLAWHANRHTFFKVIYDVVPFLYHLRFPSRLLTIATSPLLLCAGFGLQYLLHAARDWGNARRVVVSGADESARALRLPLGWMAAAPVVVILLVSLYSAFTVNKPFAFSTPQPLDPKSFQALGFLRALDREVFYVHIGGTGPAWSWMPAAYLLEMPVLNFRYNRRLASQDQQRSPESPFFATAKYVLTGPGHPAPPTARRIRLIDDWTVWHDPHALPFAFSAAAADLAKGRRVTTSDVIPMTARIAGPNRVVVRGAGGVDRKLVVLVSDYPRWKLFVDGRPAPAEAVNGYLAASLDQGVHTYTFVFRPRWYAAGMAVTLVSLTLVAAMIVGDRLSRRRPATRPSSKP